MKKICRILLASLLCLSMLLAVSCDMGSTNAGGSTPTGTTTPPDLQPPAPINQLMLVSGDVSEYKIVTSVVPTDYETNAAKELQRVIKTLTGVTIPIIDDFDDTAAGETVATAESKEIVIGGKTKRKKFYTAPANYADGYAVFVSNNRLIIEAGSLAGMRYALDKVVMDCFGIDLKTDELYSADDRDELGIPMLYELFMAFDDLLEWFGDYDIVYDGSYMQKRYAWYVHDRIESTLDVDLNVTTARPSGRPYIELCVNDAIKDGDFKIEMTKTALKISASDYYGFTGAARFFPESMRKYGYLPLDPNGCADGQYTDYLKNYEGATAYAYDNRSDLRVMFYNVLWQNPEPDERNKLNDAIVGEYMPDVLGLQEMDKTKRGNNATGKGGLIALLEARGYVEAIDPRVKNMYGTNEAIPGSDDGAVTGTILLENTKDYYDAFNQEYMNRKSGTPLKGYGTSGGQKVTVNGETYYTFFNCAPLLYNTETTECIDAGYYWYKYQWDLRTCSDCEKCQKKTHKYDDKTHYHSNSRTDAASKAATWGVFRDKETGNCYIVISTHMCTRSNYIKGLQARELINFINNEILPKHNYPVILGGDYNGKYHEPNYLYFTGEAGYTDVERSNFATNYTSHLKAHHPYPVKDSDKGFVVEDVNNATPSIIATPEASVDHILIGNGGKEKLSASVYGVVIDEMSLAGADHYPIFMDFSFKK